MSDIKEKPKPLMWLCDCGWYGTVDDMTDSLCCPECGSFDNVKIQNPIKLGVLSSVVVTV